MVSEVELTLDAVAGEAEVVIGLVDGSTISAPTAASLLGLELLDPTSQLNQAYAVISVQDVPQEFPCSGLGTCPDDSPCTNGRFLTLILRDLRGSYTLR